MPCSGSGIYDFFSRTDLPLHSRVAWIRSYFSISLIELFVHTRQRCVHVPFLRMHCLQCLSLYAWLDICIEANGNVNLIYYFNPPPPHTQCTPATRLLIGAGMPSCCSCKPKERLPFVNCPCKFSMRANASQCVHRVYTALSFLKKDD